MRAGRWLVVALAGVIALGMYVSWTALSATARAVGDGSSALVYPLVVDGLVAIAVAASLVLRGAEGHRWAMGTVLGYTFASLVLNAAHGAAASNTTGRAGFMAWAHVVITTSLPVLSTALGTHLVVLVLRHLARRSATAEGAAAAGPAPAPPSVLPSPSPAVVPSGPPAEGGCEGAPAARAPRPRTPSRSARRVFSAGPSATSPDDVLAADLAAWAAAEGVPSSRAVRARYRIGDDRARRLLRTLTPHVVAAPPTTDDPAHPAPAPAPVAAPVAAPVVAEDVTGEEDAA